MDEFRPIAFEQQIPCGNDRQEKQEQMDGGSGAGVVPIQ